MAWYYCHTMRRLFGRQSLLLALLSRVVLPHLFWVNTLPSRQVFFQRSNILFAVPCWK